MTEGITPNPSLTLAFSNYLVLTITTIHTYNTDILISVPNTPHTSNVPLIDR
jgi:hypothetical protein